MSRALRVCFTAEDAREKHEDNLIIYHGYGKHLEWNTAPERDEDKGYFKVLCGKSAGEKVVGVHVLGNSAGEVIHECLDYVHLSSIGPVCSVH